MNMSFKVFLCSLCKAYINFIANSEHLFAEIHAGPAVSRDPTQIWWMCFMAWETNIHAEAEKSIFKIMTLNYESHSVCQ